MPSRARTSAVPDALADQITMVNPHDLREHPRNANRGDVAAVVASIRLNGFYGALVVQRSTGYVLAGNHRMRAARELAMPTVPVLYVDVDDAQARRILVADNRTSELAHRDPSALLALLDDIHGEGTDALAGVGFSVDDLDALRVEMGRVDEAAFPALDDGAQSDFETMTFTLHRTQAHAVRIALEQARLVGPFTDTVNTNGNGNALHRIVTHYVAHVR